MNSEDKNPLTYGVSFTYWHQCLKSLCDNHNIELDSAKIDLSNLYHDDMSARDVYHMLRIRSVKSANLTLRWFDAQGHVEVQFSNNDQIRHFYKLHPDIKRVMETKKRF